MDADDLEKRILERIVPSSDAVLSISDRANRLKNTVQEYLLEHGIDADVMIAGSFSKGTFLADPDIDMFVMFPSSLPGEDLEELGLRMGEDILHGEKMFSDHPYTRGVYEGLDVDLVPCYNLPDTSHIQSAVDRTPFHTRYITGKLSCEQKDQVRLLKKFMKGIGAYGADQDSRGFSGYLCEVLVAKYGSFRGVLEAARSWREGTAIVVEKEGPRFRAPLVVYDPVDPARNMSSSVHLDSLCLFSVAASAYLESPSEKFFFPCEREPLTREELRGIVAERGSRLVSVVFERPDTIEDSLHSQLWKTQTAIAKILDRFSFNVERAMHRMTETELTVVFEIERDVLPKTHRHDGPPVWVETAEGFLERWSGNPYGDPFIEDGRWSVIAERQYTSAEGMLSREMAISGIGKNLDAGTARIRGNDGTLSELDPGLLTELLMPRFPWES